MQKILIFLIAIGSLFSCSENTKNLKIRENTDIEALSSISSLQALQNALEDDPENVDILYKIALWHYYKKEYSKTESFLQKAIIIAPHWKLYLLEAQSKYKNKQITQARKSWQEAYRLEPQALPILLFGLQSAIDAQDSILANKLITKTKSIYPNDPQLYYWQGKWATTQNDTTQAFSHFTKALSFNPDLVEAYLHIATLYNHYEKHEKAIVWAKKGLQIRSKYDSLLLETAIGYQALKDIDSAQKYYSKAYLINNTLYKASYELGIQAWKAGKYQEALTLFENTYRYKKDLSKINYYIGNCHEFLEKKTVAIDFYKKAVQQEPENLISRQALASLQQKLELIRMQRIQDSLLRVQQEAERKMLEEQQNKQ
ncbi:MAG: tetratricopeptide repeat protein [Raineya sp.]|jgi:tetratricopeptide (TPR) repeat protein|nr:tetratricopeptide repeat protein [Raineya sp.]